MNSELHSMLRRAALLLGAACCLYGCGSSSPVGGGASGGGQTATVDADFHTLTTPPLASGQFEIITLSTLPDAVTDNDVLVGIRGLDPTDAVSVSRNGADISSAFTRVAGSGSQLRGLVSGLATGNNTISAVANGPSGKRMAALTVVNHPITGPVISGPHQTPFVCRTKDNGLGDPLDADCSATTLIQWFYRSALTQAFTALSNPYAAYPADTAQTTLQDGTVVPYVVRVESATINRGVARIAVLDDPHARGPNTPFAPNWDHRLYYDYGESCGPGYQQGLNSTAYVLGSVVNLLPSIAGNLSDTVFIPLADIATRLGKGDIVVHSTLSAYGVDCNPLISIETAMMLKEHVIEQYGLIDTVVGTDASGGALQQYNALNNAPGLLDAAIPTASFSDIPGTGMTVVDCGLLENYFGANHFSDVGKIAAITGHNLLTSTPLNDMCSSWVKTFVAPGTNPTTGCDAAVPTALIYNAKTNPTGARCKIADANVNVLGRDPATGFARDVFDNTGIQYGLDALNSGAISLTEFLDLNSKIGGYDADGNIVAARMNMAPEVAAVAYQSGLIIGRGALAEAPVIDNGLYLDLIPELNIHDSVRPFIIRARLLKYSGQQSTMAQWRGTPTPPDSYPVVEQWFTSINNAQLPYGADHAQAVMAAKPAAAQDSCIVSLLGTQLDLPSELALPLGLQLPLLTTTPLLGNLVNDIPALAPILKLINADLPVSINLPDTYTTPTATGGVCQTLLPPVTTPRMAAGGPLTDDVIKCQLKPVDPTDYGGKLSAAQLAQVSAVFPNGVCDWTQPGVGELPAGQNSVIWPSIGGTTLSTDGHGNTVPFGLKWRVARSQPVN